MSNDSKFTPKLIGMICNWCCYGGADLCGVSRFQYPPYIRLIRIMCSARVDMKHIFRAFSNGTDGMFIGGCHLSDCHYITHGNYYALNMVLVVKKIMEHMGINPKRLRIEWVSAGEGIRFANVMNEFGREIESLGPLGKGERISEINLEFKLNAITRLIPYIRVAINERLRLQFETMEEYEAFYGSEEFARLYDDLIGDKLAISQIMLLLRERSLSTREISEVLGLNQSDISRHLNNTARQGLVRYEEGRWRFALA
ncbi:MAG: hydrogenase iron-sulfur subunit [Firmicutes bacterium]|nr:hydrogenase iron-sulfur subunit [Bacillota bacterium]